LYVQGPWKTQAMKHAPVHNAATQQNTIVLPQRPVTGPNSIAFAPPAYGIDFVDRQQSTDEEMPIQREVREDSSEPERQQENRTGLPDHLKAGIETLSGLSLDDVHIHYNSAKPAEYEAHAYTQGTEIHVGTGKEKYVPHEAWHVVQQKQGRVRSTMQMNGASINDNPVLEQEADDMGQRALKSGEIMQAQRETISNASVYPLIDYAAHE
jgi:hypothetical protein